MWSPPVFRERFNGALFDLIERHNFGLLVSIDGNRPVATHIPFLLDRQSGPNGTLVAHVARANPQWRLFAALRPALAVFLGPHAYISPAWYASDATVPTWNYAAVHAYGTPRIIEDRDEQKDLLRDMARRQESHRDRPWDVAKAEHEMATAVDAIVGFRMPIDEIQGKFKFNQNKSKADRQGVVTALQNSSEQLDREVAEIMRRRL